MIRFKLATKPNEIVTHCCILISQTGLAAHWLSIMIGKQEREQYNGRPDTSSR